MEKKQAKAKQKASALALRKETLRSLGDSELRRVDGAARLWRPVGFDDDTAPIYSEMEMP